MRTFVEYFHDEHGNVIKRREHYGHTDEKAALLADPEKEKHTGDLFYDIDKAAVGMYSERVGDFVDQ